MNAIEYLEERRWEYPPDYGGFSPDGDYVILSRHRDSNALEDSNYEAAFKSLQEVAEKFDPPPDDLDDDRNVERWNYNYRTGENDPIRSERAFGWVYDFRAGHWACGWVEYLLVREDAPDEIKQAAGEIICALSDYPVLDEEDFSKRENDEVNESWRWLSMRERMRLCAKHGTSIFAARRDTCPDNCYIYDYLRTLDMATTREVQAIFDEFRNGANSFIRHGLFRRLVYSDGVQDLADKAGCYWLLDIIGSEIVDPYLKDWSAGHAGMGVLRLKVTGHRMVIALDVYDGEPPIYQREIEFTDFPEGDWMLYMNPDGEGGAILILPSEY